MENEQKTIRYADLFGGVGGFRLGIERACDNKQSSKKFKDWEGRNRNIDEQGEMFCTSKNSPLCVFYNDNDKYAVQTYNKNFKEDWEATDIRTIKTDSIPDIDMLCGGFPCQAFSIAGKRRGFEDTRGTLFFEIARIIKAKRPKIIFLENVKGLLNHQQGQTFRVIIQTISELGYDVQWMVLNSKFFGVPQNRERVFIIGSLRGERRPEILPFREVNQETYGESEMIMNTLTEAQGRQGSSKEFFRACKTIFDVNQAQRVYDTSGVSITLKGLGGGQGAKTGLYCVASRGRNPDNPNDRTTGSPTEQRLEVNSEGICNNLTSVQKDHMVMQQTSIRRLTPTECERLQGFPDGWTEGVSDTQRYKQMGNAVTVNVIEAIMRRMRLTLLS